MDLDPEVASVVKGGETRIIVELQRGSLLPGKKDIGVRVVVKVHPLVEDFMRALGNGETVEVGVQGRHWIPADLTKPFIAYDLQTALEPIKTPSGSTLNLERLGYPLSERVDRYEFINLSFLRLVGASQGEGASFYLKGVSSTEALRRIRDQITEAAHQFYISYLRPINLAVIVSTQER